MPNLWDNLADEFVHFRPGRAQCNSQRMAKMTCTGSYFAVVACLAFLSDGDTLEKSIVDFLPYKFYFIHAEYSLKIHWARLRPLPQCERNLGCVLCVCFVCVCVCVFVFCVCVCLCFVCVFVFCVCVLCVCVFVFCVFVLCVCVCFGVCLFFFLVCVCFFFGVCLFFFGVCLFFFGVCVFFLVCVCLCFFFFWCVCVCVFFFFGVCV